MGNKSSLLLRQEEIAQIQEDTGCKYSLYPIFSYIFLVVIKMSRAPYVGVLVKPISLYLCFDWMKEKQQNSHDFYRQFLCFPVTPNQIERLYSRFTSLDRTDCGTLSREDFLRIPELAINPLCDRIVHAFFADTSDDRVNFRQFMHVLAHFRPIRKSSGNKLNSREEKLKCKFDGF